MTPEEQQLYALLYRPPATPETLPYELGLRSVPAAPQPRQFAGGGLPDIAAYLGLSGPLWGGEYNINPRRPQNGEIPVKIRYTRPVYGGELKAEATLTPDERAFLINYYKKF